MVLPILLYGSEVLGVYDFKKIDKLHIRFCKNILGVRQQTQNIAVYVYGNVFLDKGYVHILQK